MPGKLSRILIVEDEEFIREILEFDLKRKGYEVYCQASGKDALEFLAGNAVDLVLTDLRMTQGDGTFLIQQASQALGPRLRFMVMTGYADLALEEIYDLGVEAVFNKPFQRQALFDAISRALAPIQDRWSTQVPVQEAEPLIFRYPGSSLRDASQKKKLTLGRGGMFLTVPSEPLPPTGRVRRFEVHFEGSPPATIRGIGTIQWVRETGTPERPRGLGIEFNYLQESCRSELAQMIGDSQMRPFIPKA